MNFVSVTFLAFFVVVFTLYWGLSVRWRIPVLLAASYVFYGAWDWRFLSLVIASTLLDYFTGARIYATEVPKARKFWLTVSLVGNLGLLAYFKYVNFFLDSFVALANSAGWHVSPFTLQIILPIGISFYSFQAISYSLDIYYRKLEPTRSLLQFSAYVAFFPHMVAGPIVRARELLFQLESPREFRLSNFESGLLRFANGFVKKAFVADVLAIHLVDPVFADPARYGTGTLWLALAGYSVQIYADFSGYSSMALGTSRMLGYEIPENFNFPYLSRNFSEFWRRWHMTMSRFFRDYLYISLGGNRKGRARTLFNLAVTTLVSGLWHGANWTFVAWGGLHGVFIATNQLIRDARANVKTSALYRFAGWAVTTLLVCLAWIPFRSTDFATAWTYFERLAGASGEHIALTPLVALAFVAFLLDHLYGWISEHRNALITAVSPRAWGIGYAALVVFLYHAVPRDPHPFIYFQF